MRTKNRFSAVAMIGFMVAMSISTLWAAQQVRLTARANKVINSFQAELRGDYRESNNSPSRLNADLEKINIPIGTKVAFCLVQNGVTSLVGVAQVQKQGGVQTATVELNVNDGEIVPNVDAGNVLQARQRTAAPFVVNPTCTTNLLISAPFAK